MDETVHIHVSTFSATPMNVFSNYILNKYATIDDKDPSWMKKATKNKITLKNFLQGKKTIELQTLPKDISDIISKEKKILWSSLNETQ